MERRNKFSSTAQGRFIGMDHSILRIKNKIAALTHLKNWLTLQYSHSFRFAYIFHVVVFMITEYVTN